MKILGIILLAAVLILIVCFAAWFLIMKSNGKCPVCALKKAAIPTKLTIDVADVPDYENGVKTPPMGWSSWNTFRNHINQDLIMEVAHAMKNSGLADAGYNFVNLDDCWHSTLRDTDGKLQGDLSTFSRGIPALVKDINALGLKVGIYSSNGRLTCEDLPASLGTEALDAKTIASWGCEFFKYDYCHPEVISGECPAIEEIEITSRETCRTEHLLPENAEYTGMAKTINISSLPSGKAIGFISHATGTAAFRCNVISDGEYAITIVYQKTRTQTKQYLQLIINGKLHEVFFPTSMGYSNNGRAQIIAQLKAGENTIVLQNPIVTKADSSYIQYKRMGEELKRATKLWAEYTGAEEKPITYSICEHGRTDPEKWGAKAGNMWRTTPDILPNWLSIMLIYNHTIDLYKYSKPGSFNDPDMLEVGNGKLSEDENKAHFSLWCMMASPLILGNDIRKFVDGVNAPVDGNSTLKIVTNKQLIAIDQDALCKAAKRLRKSATVDILARPLANGDAALCFLNKGPSSASVRFEIDKLTQDEYIGLQKSSEYELHELWSDERTNSNTISVVLSKHSVKVYRIKAL